MSAPTNIEDRLPCSPHVAVNITASWFADLWREVSAGQAEKRAAQFDAAAHRPGIDYPGQQTPEQLEAQARRCHEVASALRAKATVTRARVA